VELGENPEIADARIRGKVTHLAIFSVYHTQSGRSAHVFAVFNPGSITSNGVVIDVFIFV